MINQQLIQSRLSLIMECHRQIEESASIAADVFVKRPREIAATESFLRRALEAIFDVGRHILARQGHNDLALEYKSIARGLGSISAVPDEFVPTLERMAGYRNRLVHFYHEISPAELHLIVTDYREDLRTFARYMRDYVTQAGRS